MKRRLRAKEYACMIFVGVERRVLHQRYMYTALAGKPNHMSSGHCTAKMQDRLYMQVRYAPCDNSTTTRAQVSEGCRSSSQTFIDVCHTVRNSADFVYRRPRGCICSLHISCDAVCDGGDGAILHRVSASLETTELDQRKHQPHLGANMGSCVSLVSLNH